MRFSFDVDGTLIDETLTPVLRTIVDLLVAGGHEVWIMTGRLATAEHEARTRATLRELGYPEFHRYLGRTEDYVPFNGAKFKSAMIVEHGIALHFDDYDFDHPDTIRLFDELGVEHRVARVRSTERREWSARP